MSNNPLLEAMAAVDRAVSEPLVTNTPRPGEAPASRVRPIIAPLISERGKTHGEYTHHAAVTQALKEVFYGQVDKGRLSPDQRESIDMIFHKLGRIGAGDPNFRDHWDDIAGYAVLSAERCK